MWFSHLRFADRSTDPVSLDVSSEQKGPKICVQLQPLWMAPPLHCLGELAYSTKAKHLKHFWIRPCFLKSLGFFARKEATLEKGPTRDDPREPMNVITTPDRSPTKGESFSFLFDKWKPARKITRHREPTG